MIPQTGPGAARRWRALVAISASRYAFGPVSDRIARTIARFALLVWIGAMLCAGGCIYRISSYAPGERPIVDRRYVEYPTGMVLEVVAEGFTAATALAPDDAGRLYVADRGWRGREVRITRINLETGEKTEVYPVSHRPLLGLLDKRFRLFGPVGGMVYSDGELYVSARDENDDGVVVALDLANWTGELPTMRTVVGELPARGDHGITDLALQPTTGRLFFGLGSATNSGVVGVDNWEVGWLRRHSGFHDRPLVEMKIGGYRFDTEDPAAGPLNPDKVNTAPFNPFRRSNQRIEAAAGGKPTAAIYSVDPLGGDLRVEAHGLRHPRGLAFNEFGNLYASNQGMELRGTRPVKDDPDAIVRVPLSASIGITTTAPPATWFGWPDYSAELISITDERYQPPTWLLGRTGYRELSPLIDYRETELDPADRETLLAAVFPSLSGAAGMTFVPDDAHQALEPYMGMLLVALNGDRAPFSTSGLPLVAPVGYKFVLVDPERRTVHDFIYNVAQKHEVGEMLNRPIDVAFAPDGTVYLLDLGQMRMRGGSERHKPGTGRVYRLAPVAETPASTQATD